jgi:transmembrane sensor
VGTKFDVRRDDGTVHVSLLEGTVRVRRDARPGEWTLAPNQQLTVTGAGASAPRAIDAARTTSWTTGRLVFHETPLAAAVAEVNRYADRKVELQGDNLGRRRVNGVFDVGDTDAFVAGVSALFDLKATPAPGGSIRLQPANPPAAAAD